MELFLPADSTLTAARATYDRHCIADVLFFDVKELKKSQAGSFSSYRAERGLRYPIVAKVVTGTATTQKDNGEDDINLKRREKLTMKYR